MTRTLFLCEKGILKSCNCLLKVIGFYRILPHTAVSSYMEIGRGAGNAGPQLFVYSVVVAFTLIAKLNKMKHKKHNDCTFTSIDTCTS